MSIQRLQKYVNLALNNSSEGEARNAASRFFKTLKSLDMRFNSKTWGLNKEQALKLADLGGVALKLKAEPTVAAETVSKPKKANKTKSGINVRETCYEMFDTVDMTDPYMRKYIINRLVDNYGFNKPSVQSYASNYRAGK